MFKKIYVELVADVLLVGMNDGLKKIYNVYKDNDKGKVSTTYFFTNIKKKTKKVVNVGDQNKDISVK